MSHNHKWKYYKREQEWRCRVRNCTASVTPAQYLVRFGSLRQFDPPPYTGLDRIMDEREKAGANV